MKSFLDCFLRNLAHLETLKTLREAHRQAPPAVWPCVASALCGSVFPPQNGS